MTERLNKFGMIECKTSISGLARADARIQHSQAYPIISSSGKNKHANYISYSMLELFLIGLRVCRWMVDVR